MTKNKIIRSSISMCVCMHWIAEVALTIIIFLMIIKKACHQYLNLHFWTISPQKKTSISFWSCSVLIVPLYKRYKQTAFALHINGYLQEREGCVCVRSSPRQPVLSEENTAVIIKGTKHWRLKTHERKRKHTSQSRLSQTHSLVHKHAHWYTHIHS